MVKAATQPVKEAFVDTDNLLVCRRQLVDIDQGAILQGYAERPANGWVGRGFAIASRWIYHVTHRCDYSCVNCETYQLGIPEGRS